MSADFDLAVVGGGPAGAAATLGAARAGLSVALFEPQAMPADKPCGEGIMPAGVQILRRLGLEALVAGGQPLARIRYVLASGRELDVLLSSPACAIERPALERALAGTLADEPRVTRIARRVDCQRSADGFTLAAGADRWHARALVAADGLAGESAGWLRRGRGAGRRYGLRARAELRAPLASVEVHLGGGAEVYLTPLGRGRVNVAVLRDGLPAERRSAAELLAAALEQHPRAARVLGAWVTPPEGRALARLPPRALARERAFLAGDATGGVDPVLGCGVAIALTTGSAAAQAAARALAGEEGRAERDHARHARQEVRLRRAVAHGLLVLSARPRLQEGVARVFRGFPALGRALAARIGGS